MKLLEHLIDKNSKFIPRLLWLHNTCKKLPCVICPYCGGYDTGVLCQVIAMLKTKYSNLVLPPSRWTLPPTPKDEEEPSDLSFLLDVTWDTIMRKNNETS